MNKLDNYFLTDFELWLLEKSYAVMQKNKKVLNTNNLEYVANSFAPYLPKIDDSIYKLSDYKDLLAKILQDYNNYYVKYIGKNKDKFNDVVYVAVKALLALSLANISQKVPENKGDHPVNLNYDHILGVNNFDSQDNSGLTPLMLSIKMDNKKLFDFFMVCGADINKADKLGYTPITRLLCGDYLSQNELVWLERLTNCGANVKEPDQNGLTAFNIVKEQCNEMQNPNWLTDEDYDLSVAKKVEIKRNYNRAKDIIRSAITKSTNDQN